MSLVSSIPSCRSCGRCLSIFVGQCLVHKICRNPLTEDVVGSFDQKYIAVGEPNVALSVTRSCEFQILGGRSTLASDLYMSSCCRKL